MGQKVNPIGIRLGIVRKADSVWYASGKKYADYLNEDLIVRNYIQKKLANASISRVKIERPANNAKITVYAARPGVIIGKKGADIEIVKNEVSKIMNVPVHINIEEVRKPDLDAKIVADGVAQQLERRVMFRRAMKRAVQSVMRAGASGVKIMVSGRVGGAEIARSESYREGRVPLHTFRADIDYSVSEANTTYGIIGVKVWIFREQNSKSEGRANKKHNKKAKVE